MGYSSNYQIYVQEAVALEIEADDHVVRKKACWENAGNAMEIDGVPKIEIGKKLQATIESKIFEKTGQHKAINTSHWYDIINKHHWGIRSGQITDDEEMPEQAKSNSADEESEDDTTEQLESPDYSIENQRLLDAIEKTITSLRKASTYSKLNPV